MNKMNLAGASLVAALPAGFLLYLMLMAMMNHMDSMPTVLMVASVALFLVALFLVLFPVFVLIYHGGSKNKAATPAEENAVRSAVPSADSDDDLEGSFDDERADEDESGEVEASSDDEDGFDFDDDIDGDEFEFDDDEEEF